MNLSEGRIALQEFFGQAGDAVELEFALPSSHLQLQVEGRVAWAENGGNAGVTFRDMPATQRRELRGWLDDEIQRSLRQPR